MACDVFSCLIAAGSRSPPYIDYTYPGNRYHPFLFAIYTGTRPYLIGVGEGQAGCGVYGARRFLHSDPLHGMPEGVCWQCIIYLSTLLSQPLRSAPQIIPIKSTRRWEGAVSNGRHLARPGGHTNHASSYSQLKYLSRVALRRVVNLKWQVLVKCKSFWCGARASCVNYDL